MTQGPAWRTSLRVWVGTALAAMLLQTGCINWADAPYLDSTGALSKKSGKILRADYPGATLNGRVYRVHMENRWGRYRVVSRSFLFEDSAGKFHRGAIDKSGALTVRAVTFADQLPAELQQRLFEAQGAPIAGGTLAGKAWSYTESGSPFYEFEFVSDRRRGLCRAAAAGTSHHVEYLRTAIP